MKRLLLYFFFALSTLSLFLVSVFFVSPISNVVSDKINTHLYEIHNRNKLGVLSVWDKRLLKSNIWIGAKLAYWQYPEASRLLQHYSFGDGGDLVLDSQYFSQSRYLNKLAEKYGTGVYGPIIIKQQDDYRLSLALNPFYLKITDKTVTLYHSRVNFRDKKNLDAYTWVRLGKLNIKVYDSLAHVADGKTFSVSSTWQRNQYK